MRCSSLEMILLPSDFDMERLNLPQMLGDDLKESFWSGII